MRLTLEDPAGVFSISIDLAKLMAGELPSIGPATPAGGLVRQAPAQQTTIKTQISQIDGQPVTIVYRGDNPVPIGSVWRVSSQFERYDARGLPWAAHRSGQRFATYHESQQDAITAVVQG